MFFFCLVESAIKAAFTLRCEKQKSLCALPLEPGVVPSLELGGPDHVAVVIPCMHHAALFRVQRKGPRLLHLNMHSRGWGGAQEERGVQTQMHGTLLPPTDQEKTAYIQRSPMRIS